MSWDVFVMRADGVTSVDQLATDYKPPPLGDAEQLRGELSQLFPTLDWTDPKCGCLDAGTVSFTFSLAQSGSVDSFMLHVRGGGDALSPIVAMCRQFGWQAFDCSEGDFIDLNNPSHVGWEGWQAFRDRVISRR